MPRWLLPESISDVLPSEARRIEELRRLLLDQYRSYGYEMVMPPMIEHLESLLTGAGTELSLRTFQLVDQMSGRTMGLRADMTAQVARIDAHLLGRVGVTRLCYAGSVLHARPAGPFATREPFHVGAEIYGHGGVEADLEILDLMARSIKLAGIDQVRVDLCHMGIVPALLEQDRSLDPDVVYRLLQAKDVPGLQALLDGRGSQVGDALLALASLYGPALGAASVINVARATLPPLVGIGQALDELQRLVESPQIRRLTGLDLSIDLADLRGYRYHSGMTFAAYVPGLPNAVARGGRYDNVGEVFGRARPASGFSLELRELASLQTPAEPARAIRAPWSDDTLLLESIAQLRAEGQIVIQSLPGHESEQQEFVFDSELVVGPQGWVVRALV